MAKLIPSCKREFKIFFTGMNGVKISTFNIRDMNPGHSMSMFGRDPEMTQG